MMKRPHARGPISGAVLRALTDARLVLPMLDRDVSTLTDHDFQLALWSLYELHYRGFDDVDDALEWDPRLLRARLDLEDLFERDLRALAADVPAESTPVADSLKALLVDDRGPSLPRYIHRDATAEEFREFLVHRSVYHLKESDPHSWALPRLDGPAKVALAEILYDEFGAGRTDRLHSRLFAQTLEGVGLSSNYGEYVDAVPGITLAVNNAMSLLGLHRRHRGAILGHLAAFEATSSIPNRRYSQGAARLGHEARVLAYFEEHVTADAVHEQIALRGICGQLVAEDPAMAADVLFGAAVCLRLNAMEGAAMLDRWHSGASSLLMPIASAA